MNVVKLRKGMKQILFLIFVFNVLFSFSAGAYSIDNSSNSAKSIFNQNPLQFAPIDINKFIKTDRSGLAFDDLVNAKSFSSQDIGSSIKAVLILFIRLIVTTLNVTLGILKALLEVLTKAV